MVSPGSVRAALPLPRTKLEATVPDGQVTGVLEIDGRLAGVVVRRIGRRKHFSHNGTVRTRS